MISKTINSLIVLVSLMILISCSSKNENKSENQHEVIISSPIFSIPKLPQEMMFCGEKIILKDEDVRERLEREVLLNAYYHSATIGILKKSTRFFPQIEQILKEKKIPIDFKYLAVIESGLVQAVSPVGAQGFWQFMPFTAKEFDLEMSDEVDERLPATMRERVIPDHPSAARLF